MDCDKFESAMMDDLYGELDELTSAALKRHVASCAACAGLLDGLRATLRVATVPRVQPPADLEARILRAAFPSPVSAVSTISVAPAASHQAPPSVRVPSIVPFGRRAARALSVAGNWAMRPQTAMAAVFLVMIGTSGLLLRGRSSRAPAGAAVTVTEEGTPAPVAAGGGLAGGSPSPLAGPTPGAPAAAANNADPLASAAPLGAIGALRSSAASSGGGPFASAAAGAPGQGALAMNGPGDDGKPSAGLGRAAARLSGAPKAAPARKGAVAGADGPFADFRGTASAPPAHDEAVAEPTAAEAARETPNFAQAPAAPPPPVVAQSAPAAAPMAAAPAAAAPASAPSYPAASFDDAMNAYRARRFDDASRSFDALSSGDPRADLWAARAQREGNGCGAAVARFDEVASRVPGTPVGWDAALDGGRCYRFLGNAAGARARLTPLLKVPAYADRARAELSALSHAPASGGASSRP
ncbi:MAG TPA: zf-HC2 domain-containing protein [Polyangiaceae bacterium]|nr:zf-HC2 domain-containing protein [Polyangiaceae bacterium]